MFKQVQATTKAQNVTDLAYITKPFLG